MLLLKRRKLDELKNEGKDPFVNETYDVTAHSKDIKEEFNEDEEREVSIAGRVMSKRRHGKICFLDVRDSVGTIQVFARKDVLEDKYEDVKGLDIGDIIGVKGIVFKTEAGEITVRATDLTLLSKSLQILPEKFHGLKDPDLRYRQRYVDLIVNPEVKDVFIKRNKIIKKIREFLDNKGFLEVETPILGTVAGGANARPFYTHHNTLDIDMQLRIANELFLKRLIVGGFDKVYEMGKMFRNEGMDPKHNPEFTNIELYQAYADYEEMMRITENLFEYVAKEVLGTDTINYQGTEICLKAPWKRITMIDAVKKYADVDFNEIDTDEDAREVAREKGLEISEHDTWGKVLSEMFEEFCEEHLVEPTFVIGHPVEVSPLAKRNPEDKRLTQRFEAFINTWEFANAFSELNDPIDQRERFEAQVREKEAGDDEAHPMDSDFINAIEVGLPPTGGLGIGVDRMIVLLTDQPSIRDVLLFPTMKPIGLEKAENGDLSKETYETYDKLTTEKIDFSKVKVEPIFEDMVDFDTFSKSDFRVVKVKNCEEVPKSKKLLKFTLDDGSEKERIILSGIKNFYSAEELVGKKLVAITNLPPRKMMGEESCGMLLSAVCEYDGEELLNLVMVDENIPAGAKLY
ncbi:lysine--tRNA ligase [Peptoniphilus lacydonensis]|uniref:lysine--tRNA ligase n=1 Tax=Peptoniphilus lacydonensis TaxID=1673725 RepID=UPI0029069DD3|nr:lysine--tRNA ligase [Peptoniphilus lacydonensis]MBS6610870.1 lysine--tRNA ligase [Peptoniphilus harei]MDU5378366.1 lysine--tRNA ligase [Peptoniphilus lacydonensis]MDU5437699.1 lysine--tRNA ligase [Peptoniphilus lacydonensis]